MSDNKILFIERVRLLTGKMIKPNNVALNISSKYHPLFGNKLKVSNVTLNEVANLVNDVLCRKEEHGDANLDKWGRFDHSKSILVRNRLDQSPIIDELVLDVIKQLGLTIRTVWPDGKKAAVCLTHDVDHFDGRSYLFLRKMWWRYHAYSALIKGKKDAYKNYMEKIKRWAVPDYDPMYAFDKWMELEDRYGFRSTFFFFGLKPSLSKEGRLYSYKDTRVRKTVRKLDEHRWEIGLHGGYYNYLDLNYLKQQKTNLEDALGNEVIGCRHHFLRVRFPKSWNLYAKAGFKYSSNMGWGSGFNGFRVGSCLPYKPIAGEDILEFPFQLMDSSAIEDSEEYYELFSDYLKKIKTVGGCLVLDFHAEYFDEVEFPGTNNTYRMILETLSNDKEVWVTTLKGLCNQLFHKFV